MTFVVSVPENTPDNDIVYIYVASGSAVGEHRMEKVGRFTHRISFKIDDLKVLEE